MFCRSFRKVHGPGLLWFLTKCSLIWLKLFFRFVLGLGDKMVMLCATPHCSCARSTWFWKLFGIRSSSECQRYGSFVFTRQIESTWKTNTHQEIPLLTILWMSFLSICFLVFIGGYCWLFFVITIWSLWTIFRDHIVLHCERCPGYSLTVSH